MFFELRANILGAHVRLVPGCRQRLDFRAIAFLALPKGLKPSGDPRMHLVPVG